MVAASMPAAGVSFSYDARNLPRSETRTNGVVTAYTFDPLGRVLSLVHSKSGNSLNTQTYSYDAGGNLDSAANDISQALITQPAASSVDQANELLTNGQTSYTHDSNGNRLTESGPAARAYTWDGRNRLASIADANGSLTALKYDSGHNLTEIDKTGPGSPVTQKFVFDSLANLASLTDSSGLPVSVVTGTSTDSHLASVSSGSVTFGISDLLGTTVATADSNGNITARLDYEPYGQTTGNAPASYPFTYTGRIPVDGNILYYRNRFYDTVAGRFLSEDPLLNSDVENLYRYVKDRPTQSADPFGTADIPIVNRPFPGYNFCGPGDNGRWPTNQTDICCQRHDACYDRIGATAANKDKPGVPACDAALISCVNSLKSSCVMASGYHTDPDFLTIVQNGPIGPVTLGEWLFGRLIIGYFTPPEPFTLPTKRSCQVAGTCGN
jgi:RHS repeat-associated protein